MLSTCSILEHRGNENKQSYYTKYYNLDMIVAVGYRVTSKIATQFRKWATNVLKDYLVKGYALNNRGIQSLSINARFVLQIKKPLLSCF